MGKTSKSAWTRAEAGAAAIFGAMRRVLSGSANRPDIDGDDATHPRLYIESKLRAKHAVWSLWRDTRARAAKCRRGFQGGHKTPVLALREKGRHGILLVVHEDDFREVAAEWLAAQDEAVVLEFEHAVARRRLGLTEED
jgi:hypothetical protein